MGAPAGDYHKYQGFCGSINGVVLPGSDKFKPVRLSFAI